MRPAWRNCFLPEFGLPSFSVFSRGEGFFVFISQLVSGTQPSLGTLQKDQFVKISYSCFLATLAVLPAVAQTNDAPLSPGYSPPFIVTATRNPERVDRTAASVTVVSRESFEGDGQTSVAGALDAVPGFNTARNGTPGQSTSLFTRGTEGNHTLLLVDGRRQAPNLLGGYDWANLTLDNVARIESVRTPASVLYGSDAIGGVVNLVTLSGRGLSKPEHTVSFEGGSFKSFRESFGSRGALGAFDYSIGLSHFSADYPRANNDYKLKTIRGSVGYQIAPDWYFDLKGTYNESDGGSPGSVAFPDPVAGLERENSSISPGITWDFSDWVQLKAYYAHDYQFQRYRDQFATDNQQRLVSQQGDLQADIELREDWKITLGAALLDLTVSQINAVGARNIYANQTGAGGYVQSRWSPVEPLALINSVRYDSYTDYDNAVTWRQGASWRFNGTDTLLMGSVSTSYSPPTPGDLYFPGFDNPNLKSEEAFGWEIGLRQPLLKGQLSVSATYFRNEIDNLIQFDTTPKPGYPFGRPENVASALTEGVELETEWFYKRWLETKLSYTYLTARDGTANARLLRRPRHAAALDMTVKFNSRMRLGVGVQMVSARVDNFTNPLTFVTTRAHSEDYVLLRARASYQLSKNAELWLRGENLSDVKYEQVAQFPSLRLGVFGGLKLKF